MKNSELLCVVMIGGVLQEYTADVESVIFSTHRFSQIRTSDLPSMTSLVSPFAVTYRVRPPANEETSPLVVAVTESGF